MIRGSLPKSRNPEKSANRRKSQMKKERVMKRILACVLARARSRHFHRRSGTSLSLEQGIAESPGNPASEASDCTSGNLASSRIRKGALAMESTYLYLYHGVALPASFPRGSSIASRQDQGSRP